VLTLLQSAPVERDRFASHLYQGGGSNDRRSKPPENPASKSSGVSSRWIAERLDCNGDSRKWGATVRVGGKNAPTAQPTAKNFALKDLLNSDVCLMASGNRAIVGEEAL
jgi:hypothetical protein